MGKLIRFRRKGKAADRGARPLFPPATDARSGAFPTDAATDRAEPRPGASPDPVVARKKMRLRRGAILALVLAFLGGTAAALFGDHGYLDVKRQRLHLEELRAANEAHQQRVDALKKEIDRLKTDPAAVERI